MPHQIPLFTFQVLAHHQHSAYAPTLMCADEEEDRFYDDFDQIIKQTPLSDKLVILGDFNAREGKQLYIYYKNWVGLLGRHGVGKLNSNGLLLPSKCAHHNLCITNRIFQLADKYKTTWMHPRSKHGHMIDLVIVRQSHLQDATITRAIRAVEYHQQCQSCARTKNLVAPKLVRRESWIHLGSTGCQEQSKCWVAERPIIYVKEWKNSKTLSPKCRQNSGKCKTSGGRRRQHYSDMYNTKQFFNAIKTVCGPSISGFFPLLSFDGSSLIKD